MQLVLLSPPENVARERERLCEMFDRGLDTFHLRKPGMQRETYRHYLADIPSRFRRRIMIHAHHDLVRDFSLKGVHYTEKMRPHRLPVLRGCLQSASFHSIARVQEASQHYGSKLDYAFLSPLFDSVSKIGYRSAGFDRAELHELMTRVPFELCALGGITVQNLAEVTDIGFAKVAVLGAVWKASDPVQAFEHIAERCDELNERNKE